MGGSVGVVIMRQQYQPLEKFDYVFKHARRQARTKASKQASEQASNIYLLAQARFLAAMQLM